MAKYELELGGHVTNLACDCCQQRMKRVVGFVTKDQRAHAVYFALLLEHEGERWAGLTVSIGPWWQSDAETIASRRWCHIWAANVDGKFSLRVGEPHESSMHPWTEGGTAMTRAQVLNSLDCDEFFAVADFVNVDDPAINSFLLGETINIEGRGCKHDDGTIDYGEQEVIPPLTN